MRSYPGARALLLVSVLIFPCSLYAAENEPAAKINLKPPPIIAPEPFGRLDLNNGTALSIEVDRKVPETKTGVETFEPGTIGRKPNSALGAQFFGLSIKKALQ